MPVDVAGLAPATVLRERLEMVRMLRSAGTSLITCAILVTVLEGLAPAAGAVTFAALVGAVHDAALDNLMTAALAPIGVYVVILLLGHALGAVREPLTYLVQARVDGAHRAALGRMTATSHTIGVLERPEVQQLIHQARADPENWSERTPGQGSVAQLELVGRAVAVVSSGAVLAVYAWWLVPLVVVPAALMQRLIWQDSLDWYRVWRHGSAEGVRANMWSDAITSPAEGKEARVFGFGGWAVDRINAHFRGAFDPMWALGRRLLGRQWRQALFVAVPLPLAYLVVALDAARGRSAVGTAAAVLGAGMGVFQALGADARSSIGAVLCLDAARRLRAELTGSVPAAEAAASAAVTTAIDADPPLIRFEDVSFTYPGTDRPVLTGLSVDLRPGELLGIVGLNGAGKSTLIKLLSGLYEPTAGRITADGVDIARIGPTAWRRHIAVVFQDFVRYHLSAADNVALGNAGKPRDQRAIEAAARDAGFADVVAGLPNGWDTPLARSRTGGVDLSGGQWQQLVLTRALYAVRTGARLLVLDEPTAHLDVRTEFDVFARLAAHKGDATVALISHRLSTVRQADRIVLLADGRIAEAGTHAELIALGGRYASMFAIQAERFSQGYEDRIEEGDLI